MNNWRKENRIPNTITIHYDTYLSLENWDTPNEKLKTVKALAEYELMYLFEVIIIEQNKHLENSDEFLACDVDKYIVEGEILRRMWN